MPEETGQTVATEQQATNPPAVDEKIVKLYEGAKEEEASEKKELDGMEFADGDDEEKSEHKDAAGDGQDKMPQETDAEKYVEKNRDDEDSAPKKEEQPESDAEPSDVGMDDAVLAKAKELGFSEDEARLMGEPLLLKALSLAVQKSSEQPPRAEGDEPKPAKESAKAGKPEPAEGDFEISLDNRYDEGLVAEMKKMSSHYSSQISELRKQVAELSGLKDSTARFQQYIETQRAEQFGKWLDDKLSGLGEYGDTFGKGSIADVNDQQRASRIAIAQQMHVINAGRTSLGIPPYPNEKALAMAVASLHGETAEKRARDRIAGETNKRRTLGTMRPTHRSTRPSANSDKQFMERAKVLAKERGMVWDDADENEGLDGLLE